MSGDPLPRLLRAWLVTAVVDGLFSSALAVLAYGSTVARLWQRVASTLLGPSAFEGGAPTVLLGLVMHVGVALVWSALFLALVLAWPGLRRVVATPAGIAGVAAVYGPVVWIVMSFAVIPALTGQPPTPNARWWVQLVGHIPFVALPIVLLIGWPAQSAARPAPGRRRGPRRAASRTGHRGSDGE
jgi:hypothetical protein